MRLYLVEPYKSPDRRLVVAAINADDACRKVGVAPGHARIKDQTRFALRTTKNEKRP